MYIYIYISSFKNINPPRFDLSRRTPEFAVFAFQVVLWRFGLRDFGGPISHRPVATDQIRAHAQHHQGGEGQPFLGEDVMAFLRYPVL